MSRVLHYIRLRLRELFVILSLIVDIDNDTISAMEKLEKILTQMRHEPANVRFRDLQNICEVYFGKPRQSGGSHVIFKTPWPGNPRVNIQNAKGKAKVYQVRQVLLAIEQMGGKQ